MATYYHGNSDMQTAEGLQTLVLMNPSYVQYSDTPPPSAGNLVFLNSAGSSMNQQNTPPAPPQPQTQQFVGIPLQATASASHDHNTQSMHAQHEIQALHGFAARGQYNLWNSVGPNTAARDIQRAQQGLSLSLSSQQPGYGSQAQAGGILADDMRVSGGSPSSASGVTNGISTMQSVLLSSKYLKAAQDLLDEVVNVGGVVRSEASKKIGNSQLKGIGESSSAGGGREGSVGAESIGKRATELSTVERQEIQMKKAKLISMVDEVEQRYRHYHQQMQIVISTFEQAAGIGCAKTYTSLALKTISKQFRCLKDSILGQIRAANKSLGEEDSFGGGSRLKYVDHHLRQQRALQQLGMIQHSAWRPQRGLPERAVSVLRAWLFEHFLHPYPKDSDKIMLAKQTGLTRGQVSNWFINARVRLWKPMVEEMYMEEMKEHDQQGSEDKQDEKEQKESPTSKSHAPQEQDNAIESQAKTFNFEQDNSTTQHFSAISTSMISSPVGGNVRNQSEFNLIGLSELEGMTQGSPKKHRSLDMLQSHNSIPSMANNGKSLEANNEQISLGYNDERQSRDGYSIVGGPTNFTGGFGQCPIEDLGRFDAEQFTPRFSGNNVYLTLGLPHCENLSLSGTHQTFLSNQNVQMGRSLELGESTDFGSINTTAPHSTAAFENINIQNRKRFVAQLLPDYVA